MLFVLTCLVQQLDTVVRPLTCLVQQMNTADRPVKTRSETTLKLNGEISSYTVHKTQIHIWLHPASTIN